MVGFPPLDELACSSHSKGYSAVLAVQAVSTLPHLFVVAAHTAIQDGL